MRLVQTCNSSAGASSVKARSARRSFTRPIYAAYLRASIPSWEISSARLRVRPRTFRGVPTTDWGPHPWRNRGRTTCLDTPGQSFTPALRISSAAAAADKDRPAKSKWPPSWGRRSPPARAAQPRMRVAGRDRGRGRPARTSKSRAIRPARGGEKTCRGVDGGVRGGDLPTFLHPACQLGRHLSKIDYQRHLKNAAGVFWPRSCKACLQPGKSCREGDSNAKAGTLRMEPFRNSSFCEMSQPLGGRSKFL